MIADEWYPYLKRTKDVTTSDSNFRHTSHLYVSEPDDSEAHWLWVTDHDVTYGQRLPGDVEIDECPRLLKAESLRDWMKYAEGEVRFIPDGEHTTVVAKSRAKVLGIPPEEMVELPERADECIEVDGPWMAEAAEKCWRTIGHNPSKANLMSANLRAREDDVVLETGNTYGITVIRGEPVDMEPGESVMIPLRLIDLLRSADFEDGETLKIGKDHNEIILEAGGQVWACPPISANFPDLMQFAIHQSDVLEAPTWTMDVEPLLDRCRQAENFTLKDQRKVQFAFDDDELTLQVETSEKGAFSASVEAEGDGSVTTYLSVSRMIDLLRKYDGDAVTFHVESQKPVCAVGGDQLMVLMPFGA